MSNSKLKKSLNFTPAKNKGIISLLKTLNVPNPIINKNKGKINGRGTSFWQRNEEKLEYLLHDIREYYLKTIKEFHPDKCGGDLEKSKIVNSAWKEVKKRFENRLNPRIYIRN